MKTSSVGAILCRSRYPNRWGSEGGDTMECLDEAMINLQIQHDGGFEDEAYSTYGDHSD